MKNILLVMLLAISAVAIGQENTGDYCSHKPEACAPREELPNLLPVPEQVDWDEHPIYESGGQPPKDAK